MLGMVRQNSHHWTDGKRNTWIIESLLESKRLLILECGRLLWYGEKMSEQSKF